MNFKKLEKLSVEELNRSLERLVVAEKENLACLVARLGEVSKRRVYLELGYKSLFEYCVRHLGLSEGSSYRRIQVANVCRRFPEVLTRPTGTAGW